MHMNKAEFEAAFAAVLLEPGYYLIHFHGKDIALRFLRGAKKTCETYEILY